MDKTLKDKWIAALRSGKYKQCKIMFRSADKTKHSAFGVLLDIIGNDFGIFSEEVFPFHIDGLVELGYGFKFKDYKTFKKYSNMIRQDIGSMNNKGIHFNEIAQWIEENL